MIERMQQNFQIVLRRFPAAPLLLGLTVVALLAGVAIAEERWPYLLMLALIPLLWFFPIETTVGLFALSIPFEGVSELSSGTTAIWILGLLAGGTLVTVGLLNNRFVKPPRNAIFLSLIHI